MSLLDELRATFPVGATSGTFDAAAVQGGEYMALLTGLGIPTTLGLISPQGWVEQEDGSITLSGTVTTTALGVSGVPIDFSFVASGTDYVVTITLHLPTNWTFGQSFPALQGGTMSALSLDPVHPATLTVSSAASGPALAFTGTLDPNSPAIALITWLIDGGAQLPVAGPVGYDAQTGAVDMALPLATGTIPNLFGSSGPVLDLELDLWSGLDPVPNHYAAGVRFSTTLDFGGKTITLAALLANPDQGILDVTLTGSALDFPAPSVLDQYFGHNNGIASALPDKFSGGNLVQVDSLTFGIGLETHSLEYVQLVVGALTGQIWAVWPGVIELGDLGFIFQIFQPLGASPSSAFSFAATLTLGQTVPLVVRGVLPGEVLTVGLDPRRERPKLAAIAQHVFGETFGIPDDLLLAQVEMSADVAQKIYGAAIGVEGEWSFDFGIENAITFEGLSLELGYSSDGGPYGDLAGRFAVGFQEFSVSFAMTKANAVFNGHWQDRGKPLTYQDIAIALGMYGLPNPPDGLDLELAEASFEFDSAAPSFSFAITTASHSEAVLIAGKNAQGAWGFVYGMILSLTVSVDLTDIPVVGKLVPSGYDKISLSDLRVVGATRVLPVYHSTPEIDTIIGPSLSSGIALSAKLALGTSIDENLTIRFGGADDGTQDDVPPSSSPALFLEQATGGASPAPQATWVNIQRAFGPVQLQRLGFAFTAGDDLALLVDGAVTLGGLTIGLIGLEAEMPLKSPYVPSFALAGLQIGFVGGGVNIGGGLEKVPDKDPAEYTGELTITLASFGLLALGSYTTVHEQPSLFVFLFLDAPLGGPAFFFVTGLAGGFGYNRSLQLPTIDQVASFPLVAGATGQLDPTQTEAELNQKIGPALGEDWLAAGVRFTSFEMVSSFALLTVAFGTHFEIALMGESTISVPTPAAGETIPPTAQAQMVLLVDVDPSNGQLSVSAQLTPQSYVLDQAAQLTGGFAFYVWFPPSPHAGDFVVTLGGYNPYFTPPDYYPTPPRLGLNWKLSDQLSITGGLYFALTPSVLMAGGTLEATWQSGDLNAWFDAQADFLIRFKPFQYLIDVSVTIGVSLTVHLGVTTKCATAHASVTVTIWGPPFGGTAHVDLSIVSFTINFGHGRPSPQPDLDWASFRQSFLPAANKGERSGVPSAPALGAPTPTDSIVKLAAAQGLLGSADSFWVVDPTHLRIEVTTQVPSTDASVTSTKTEPPAGNWNTQIGIGPMGAVPGSVSSTLNIVLQRAEGDQDYWHGAALTGSVPAGLWQQTSNTMHTQGLVEQAMTGVSLVPDPPTPGQTRPVPLSRLSEAEPVVRSFGWSGAIAADSDTFDQKDALSIMEQSLVDPGVAETRGQVLDGLKEQGLTTAVSVDVAAFAAGAGDLLASAPQLRLLGEELKAA